MRSTTLFTPVRELKLEAFPQPEVIRTRYPVVLMHGFGAFATVGRKGYLHHLAMHLRSHGVLAYAPNVDPYGTIETRAMVWKSRIERILDETGADKVNLIAHSMGGLDARYLIHALDGFSYIASLITLSTPHQGTALAQYALEKPEQLGNWLTGVMNWLGSLVYEEGKPNAAQTLSELTPAYIQETFNPSIPDHPAVQYWSIAGKAGKGTDIPVNPFLAMPNRLLYRLEGINDGLVSEQSAKWTNFLGTVEADHARQIGLGLQRGHYEAKGYFAALARMLAKNGL